MYMSREILHVHVPGSMQRLDAASDVGDHSICGLELRFVRRIDLEGASVVSSTDLVQMRCNRTDAYPSAVAHHDALCHAIWCCPSRASLPRASRRLESRQ